MNPIFVWKEIENSYIWNTMVSRFYKISIVTNFHVSLTVRLSMILVTDQLNAQILVL